ncbi:MAG: glycosyltransferase family 1 protein [Pseudomonas sp.]|jgi:glycosyltransferase involved in cell wall biosynthesis|uniref:glycosyltransferase family 4 protein n=1 Tax=Pseudomonas TaxID=286 RepID=UPI001C83EAFD|nr:MULTISPECIES: glycosyltransferase family 1 protein [Pseudomonas]MDO8768197.1 glycosyltransferase family 1 protein [Burkholderiaceae bacterium]MDO9327510.1 glycosyltransferase family 1 protein [Pseudomonas sp.]QZA99810.1 glycosyltransferase family 4 protein [Pseudomonas mandelii]
MKIVFNALSARLGGGQTYLINLFQFVPVNDDLEILVFAPASLKLPDHPRIRRVEPAWPTENPIVRALWEKWVLPSILKAEKADILFCPGGVVGTRAPAGCKVATMFRNMIPFDLRVRKSIPFGPQRLRNWLLNRIMLKSMSEADLTIFISNYARGVIESLTKIKNAVTIPHGIGSVFRTHSSSLARPDFLPSGEYILYVSRFDVYKHHYEVVSAFATLPQELRQRFPLILVGEENLPEAERVKSLVSTLGLEKQVLLLGAIPYQSLPPIYHHAYLNLFASSCENCPNILLEALASGRPMICSNVMPMPEFGADAALYFSPFDAKDIGGVLSEALTSPDLLDKLSVAAIAQSDKFDWENTSRKTWSELLALAEHQKQGV